MLANASRKHTHAQTPRRRKSPTRTNATRTAHAPTNARTDANDTPRGCDKCPRTRVHAYQHATCSNTPTHAAFKSMRVDDRWSSSHWWPYSIVPQQSCGILWCLVVFLPYQTPYLSSTGLSRVLVLFNNSAAELRNFVVFGCCCCCCCCFLPYIKPPISRVRASRMFWPYYYSRTTASPPARQPALFNSSAAELRNFVVFGCFLPYQTPYLASTGLSRGGISYMSKFCR
ncbi:hypothetical protein DB44_GI00020 [Candidatus Protochlamydia amoebophila]|uniref:Uncharacterized protein n=1 Tax=Candidatus Protochlamydia amoebophila TaxID=362787 RepID=A0A0C1JTY5_9BACT|nr:hypothetical protein DB44_GI00020 [Candidatus Protochlamydia amoebophila]